jgi:hypothetical protein
MPSDTAGTSGVPRQSRSYSDAMLLLSTAAYPRPPPRSGHSGIGPPAPMPVLQPSGPMSPKRTCWPERLVTQIGWKPAVHSPRFERRGRVRTGYHRPVSRGGSTHLLNPASYERERADSLSVSAARAPYADVPQKFTDMRVGAEVTSVTRSPFVKQSMFIACLVRKGELVHHAVGAPASRTTSAK